MGTGTVSVLAARFYFGRGGTALLVVSSSFFLLNLVLWLIFIATTITRFCLYPRLFKKVVFNTTESLFVGGLPIGTATLIDAALVLNQTYGVGGKGLVFFLWVCWWLALGAAFVTAFGMIYVMYGPLPFCSKRI
jgi:tellurite resistance protein TehA-like permease